MNHFRLIREHLEKRELDALLITSKYNRIYASGENFSFGAVLITQRRECYFTDSRFAEIAVKNLGESRVEIAAKRDMFSRIGNMLRAEGVKRLGIEEAYLSFREYQQLRNITKAELCPAQELLGSLRAVKSQSDLEALIEAQRMTERAYDHVLNLIKPGVQERDIAAELVGYMFKAGASGISFNPIVVAGKRGSLPHGMPTDYAIQTGDFVTMDFGFIVNGWCSDMTRTVAVGSVTEEMNLVYHTVLRAQEAGIAAARAGVMGKEIDAAARTVIENAGYGAFFCHGFGHGMGMEGHENPGASCVDEIPLPAGAVISAEPGIYIPERLGVRIEDVLYITKDGCVDITCAPKTLTVL